MTETILSLLISALSFVIIRYIIPFINSKTTEATRNNIQFWAKLAVESAEQVYKHQTGSGIDKKQMVLDFLDKRGLKIPREELDLVIEGIVYEITNSKQ